MRTIYDMENICQVNYGSPNVEIRYGLKGDSKIFNAHLSVLTAASGLVRDMVQEFGPEDLVIDFCDTDYSSNTVLAVIGYLYGSKAIRKMLAGAADIIKCIDFADYIHAPGIMGYFIRKLGKENFRRDDIYKALSLAERTKSEDLYEAAADAICKKLDKYSKDLIPYVYKDYPILDLLKGKISTAEEFMIRYRTLYYKFDTMDLENNHFHDFLECAKFHKISSIDAAKMACLSDIQWHYPMISNFLYCLGKMNNTGKGPMRIKITEVPN